jgi:hypothetical protein
MPVQANQYPVGQPSTAASAAGVPRSTGAMGGIGGAGGRSHGTPTVSGEALSDVTGNAGRSGVGTGGSVEPTQRIGTTSHGTGAPDWQGGAGGRTGSAGNTTRREANEATPLSDRRGEGSSTSARSEGDAGE